MAVFILEHYLLPDVCLKQSNGLCIEHQETFPPTHHEVDLKRDYVAFDKNTNKFAIFLEIMSNPMYSFPAKVLFLAWKLS